VEDAFHEFEPVVVVTSDDGLCFGVTESAVVFEGEGFAVEVH